MLDVQVQCSDSLWGFEFEEDLSVGEAYSEASSFGWVLLPKWTGPLPTQSYCRAPEEAHWCRFLLSRCALAWTTLNPKP